MENNINEKAKSKSQQRLFGMVSAYKGKSKAKQKEYLDSLPKSLADKIKSIADGERKKTGDKRKKTKGMSEKDIKDFAKTKHEDLPEKVEESILRFDSFILENNNEEQSVPQNHEQHLEGGNADGMSLEDIADKHNVDVQYFYKILEDAIKIEMEHTDERSVAEKIVKDHLFETPLYYHEEHGLPAMEEKLEDMDKEEVDEIISSQVEQEQKIKKFDEYDG